MSSSVNEVNDLMQKQNRWITEILAISSLSLAAKMRNTDISTSLTNLQVYISS